ncbi:MAG: ankyrin repeat domain-containing protein [Lautropia sp.]|nr:ankyrin repeat domain-containing protein [Lautropia sp.]
MSTLVSSPLRLSALVISAVLLQACGGGHDAGNTRAAVSASPATSLPADAAAPSGTPSATDTADNAPHRVLEGMVQSSAEGSASAGQDSTDVVPGFRFGRREMEDIANPGKLSKRVFYTQPSQGPDARWFDAVKRGDMATVRQMVSEGQNLEARDEAELGQTALGWAAFIGYEDMVDFLIAQGADLNATDRGDVYNVLKSAALGKNARIVAKVHDLLRATTDLNDQTVEADGETLLMVAASNNRLDVARYLIGQGANVNLVATTTDRSLGAYDQGPLSYACDRNHPEMQQLLISHGAVNHRTGKPGC